MEVAHAGGRPLGDEHPHFVALEPARLGRLVRLEALGQDERLKRAHAPTAGVTRLAWKRPLSSGGGRSEMSSPGNASWCIWVFMSPGSTAWTRSCGCSAARIRVICSSAAFDEPYPPQPS